MRYRDQEALCADVEEKLTRQIERAEALVRPLSADERSKPRSDGGWSVDQILAHLARTNETYLRELSAVEPARSASDDSAASSGRSSPRSAGRRWRPTTAGRLLLWSVTTRLSLPAPKIFQPADLDYEGDALEAFRDTQRALLENLDRNRHAEWSRLSCTSPASSLVRLNLGDVFLVLAEHGERHMKQLERQCAEVRGLAAR